MAPPPPASFVAPTADQLRRSSSPIPIANDQTLTGMVSPQPLVSSQLQVLGSTRSKSKSKSKSKNGAKGAGANKSSPPAVGNKPVFQFGAARSDKNASSNSDDSEAKHKTDAAEEKKIEWEEKDTDDEVANTFTLTAKGTEPTPAARSDLTSFESLTKEHIRPLIELNDRMNRLLTRESKINPTSIVVAGDQSHGKTSLLEALSGVDLPRGEGIQTRVPLVLQLRSASFGDEHAVIRIQPGRDSEDAAADAAVSSKQDDGERISLEDIADRVREYTNLAAGEGKDIKDRPIELKVFRNNQDDLTLIDLPGITRVAIKGQAGGNDEELENIILAMYGKYLEPKETIILNVASAQMDICTSQSVKISRKLDKTGKRTMLCITKVDEHANASRLNKAIESDIATLGLNPVNVFAVRNRSQDENDQGISLEKVRKMERQHLEILARERDGSDGLGVRYGLGVEDLSKRLVSIQRDQILQTLPSVRKAIKEKINELQGKLDKLGKPVGDAKACRAKVLHCIEASVTELQNEVLGRSPQRIVSEDELEAGTMFEISLTIENFSDRRDQTWKKNKSICQKKRVGGFDFELSIYPLYKDPDGAKESEEEDKPDVPSCVAGFLGVTSSEDVDVNSMVVTWSLTGTGNGNVSSHLELRSKEYAELIENGSSWGTRSLFGQEVADSIDGQATFVANVFIEKIDIERSASAEAEKQDLLCATLNNLQEELVTSIDTLYSNHYFFSSAFRLKLAHEVSSCRGGIGLPGTIAPHVPVNILKRLRLKLPEVIESYRNQVKTACMQKMKAAINLHFEEKIHPNLNQLVVEASKELLEKMAMNLVTHHALILEWEDSICSSNHYFMDTVQSIRSSLSDDESDRPAYLKHLSDKMIKKMSNEDQRIVDMQIEIFAYWKLMKKRLVDYVIMSTQSELVSKPFSKMLKPTLMEVTMAHGDDEMIRLLDSNPQIVKERKNTMDRLDLLQKAQVELEKHDQNISLLFS